MSIIEGIIVIVFIVGVFTILALNIVRSDRIEPDAPRDRYPSPPMWTTVTTYGPKCPSMKISGERRVKLCTLGARHSGECQYKIIELGGSEKNDEELS